MGVMLSVIVPVYNAEAYLHRCIDSILMQTYINYELLLIDDGSTDKSGAICDEYLKKDSRVRVFHKDNGGVSSARDMGLGKSQGEWVTFIDSDDWVDNSFLQVMIEKQSPQIDLILTSVSDNKILSPSEYVNDILKRKLPSQLWGKLYRKSILKNSMCLPRELYWGEDLISNVIVGLNLKGDVLLLNEQLYNYSVNETSVSSTRKSSIEYEEYFLNVLHIILGKSIEKYRDALNYTKLYIIEDLIVCKQLVNYDIIWVKELIEWGKTQDLSLRQKIILTIRHNHICRYFLALERRVYKIYKKYA